MGEQVNYNERDDEREDVVLSFDDAEGALTLSFAPDLECSECVGFGTVPAGDIAGDFRTCPVCGGSGSVSDYPF